MTWQTRDVANEAKQGRNRKLRVISGWGVAVLVVGLGVPALLATPAVNQLLPESNVAECTVGNPAEIRSAGGRRTRSVPLANTDCGAFRVSKATVCTSDPSRDVHLSTGIAYDLVVRGPRIPFFSSPRLVSARVSATQPPADEGPGRFDELEAMSEQLDETLNEIDPEGQAQRDAERAERDAALGELDAEFSPEALRAFDYEQPPYDPRCDSWRMVMTSKGLQQMSLADGEAALMVPAGVTPREPRLACEGFDCPDTGE